MPNQLTILLTDAAFEPYDTRYANSGDEILFYYSLPDAEADELDGSETFVWDFDAANTVKDQLVQTLTTLNEPITMRFFRFGSRTVSLTIKRGAAVLYANSVTFTVYEFPVDIEGGDFVAPDAQHTFRVVDATPAQSYQWYVNGEAQSTAASVLVDFAGVRKVVLKAVVTNGALSRTYFKTVLVRAGNASSGKRYETNVTPNLSFFNKEGDHLNFELLPSATGSGTWDGDLLFNTNSTETFKTVALYIAEHVKPLAYTDDALRIDRFQLFNETGMRFQPRRVDKIYIQRVENVSVDTGFYSKWLYAPNIQLQLPLGAEVRLHDFSSVTLAGALYQSHAPIADFDSLAGGAHTFTVVGNKQDAVMVLSATANAAFSPTYNYGTWKDAQGKTVRVPQGYVAGANLIQVLDAENLSEDWNESAFQSLLYDKKKLTVVGSKKNNGLYTVDYLGNDVGNRFATKYQKLTTLSTTFIQPDYDFRVTLNLKTSKVFLSSSAVDFLPASNDYSLNQKDILVWQNVAGKDKTPGTLRRDLGFKFEQPDPLDPLPNLDNIFKTVEVGLAKDVLTAQTTDEGDLRMAFPPDLDLHESNVSIGLNGVTFYEILEGTHWFAAATPEESATRLAYYIETQTTGVDVIAVGREIWFHVRQGYALDYLLATCGATTLYPVAGALVDNHPTYGIVNDRWALLDETTQGYIHYKKSANVFYIGYFDGVDSRWYTLPGNKKIVWAEPTNPIAFETTVSAYAYLLDTSVTFTQAADASVSGDALAQKFVDNYGANLRGYGLDVALVGSTLQFTRRFAVRDLTPASEYIAITAASREPLVLGTRSKSIESVMVLEDVVEEDATVTQRSELWRRKLVIGDIDVNAGFKLVINGLDLPVYYDNVASNLGVVEDTILDVEETLSDWGNQRFQNPANLDGYTTEVGRRYVEVLESMGVLVWLEKSLHSYVNNNPKYDTIVIESRFPNVPVTYQIFNTNDQHRILHSDVEVFEIGTNFTVTLNKVPYKMDNAGSVAATLAAWQAEYAGTLRELGVVTDVYDTVLRFSTLTEKTKISYQIWVARAPVSGSLFYSITNWRPGAPGVVLAGNEITTNTADFQSLGFATGMILNVGGCKFLANNKEYNLVLVDADRLGLSYQGACWDSTDGLDYVEARSGFRWADYDEFEGEELPPLDNHLALKTRSFIRQPREGYDNSEKTQLSVSWLEDDPDNAIFLYDFSGKQLERSISDQGIYQYQGVTPLNRDSGRVLLNRAPNRDVALVRQPDAQQTVFDRLTFDLDLIDDENNVSFLPTPLQVFIGFNSKVEGVQSRTLLLHRREDIGVRVRTTLSNTTWQDVMEFSAEYQTLTLVNSTRNFIAEGFKIGQHVQLSGSDYLNTANQGVFRNSGFEGIVTNVMVSSITFTPVNKPLVDETSHGTTRSLLPPFRRKNSAFEVSLDVLPEEIGRFRLKGETEGEDERLGVILNNFGYNIKSKDVFIFKEYDINEQGIDWSFVNAKRKEMLLVYPEIYNYIGSYRSIINSINYFGYDDLQLNEYYLNIDPASKQFNKLKKIEIPDIFDNQVEGWHETDYLKTTLPNNNFLKTKLFNLTYRITDFEGNIVLGYSLDEVITKLLGLKRWLKDEVMMLGTSIKDLTGVGSTTYTTNVAMDVKFTRKFHIRERLSPVDFKIEAYLQPVENNSRTYVVHLDFFTTDTNFAPDAYHVRITTFRKTKGKLRSVQIINEYRTSLGAYNFTADQKIDEYIRVEVSCDNGYGANFKRQRSYSLANGTFIETIL